MFAEGSKYISSSLELDLKDPVSYYLKTGRKTGFWVAMIGDTLVVLHVVSNDMLIINEPWPEQALAV